MLELRNIKKSYKVGDSAVLALNGIDINFRDNEFVAILGPSGSGKTTLLNIIGGLDRYDSGDLVINLRSTKEYFSRDWDDYRNNSIGFVFQNYNLIPHQSVLANVELALTLSGVSKLERRRRAKEVLAKVGLNDQLNKKPNQLSGGQMQRVAIARALINDPDILLADEPTGALDSETSTQIMELIREISKDRLVIMVTHNSEIAEQYASRIINIKDGKIKNDSNPCTLNELHSGVVAPKHEKVRKKKPSMSFGTALSLSFNNLLTKKGRTLITSFAGSIGIIGIALILSISNGVNVYISSIERDALASYPITIEAESYDIMQLLGLTSASNTNVAEHGSDKIYKRPMLENSAANLNLQAQKNDIGRFKQYVEANADKLDSLCMDIKYSYDVDLQIYKSDTSQKITRLRPNDALKKFGLTTNTDVWDELIGDAELLEAQYDILSGKWPENYNEVVLFLDKNNEIDDVTIYALGLADIKELNYVQGNAQSSGAVELEGFGYDEFIGLTFKVVPSSEYFQKDGENTWVDMSEEYDYMKNVVDSAQELKIVGIARPKPNAQSVVTGGTIGYMSGLTEYVMNVANNSEIVKQQAANPKVDVFTGLVFRETETTYEENMKRFGAADPDTPASISLYPKDFEAKEKIVEFIDEYNSIQISEGRQASTITYTDYVDVLMGSVTTIINGVTGVLIAFVAVSLIVSSIMIGIITYISVLERTKEIGILRSIGASKRDVSRVFNSETIIIGLTSGIIGIVSTLLLNLPINKAVESLAGIPDLAVLPFKGALILVGISVALTLIAGLIPSRVAAKKDPVKALRSE